MENSAGETLFGGATEGPSVWQGVQKHSKPVGWLMLIINYLQTMQTNICIYNVYTYKHDDLPNKKDRDLDFLYLH